jgi:hypothetical protein
MIQIPAPGRGELRSLTGSSSDDFSTILANQVAHALWREPCNANEQTRLIQVSGGVPIGADRDPPLLVFYRRFQ